MIDSKKWFQSKVAIFNILMAVAAIVAVVSPAVGSVVQGFIQQYFAEAGLAWALLNLVLRVFKSNIVF